MLKYFLGYDSNIGVLDPFNKVIDNLKHIHVHLLTIILNFCIYLRTLQRIKNTGMINGMSYYLTSNKYVKLYIKIKQN